MKRIFSGIQPTGIIHIGNYLGAIKQWVDMQDKVDEAIFCVVDLHAITVRQDPQKLRESTLSTAAWYIAAGVNPQKSAIFIQSQRPEHTELAWILNCYTQIGELSRMTQFKEKKSTQSLKYFEAHGEEILKNQLLSQLKQRGEEVNEAEIKLMLPSALKSMRESIENADFGESNAGLFTYPTLMAADILLYQTTTVPVGEDQVQHVELTRDIAKRFNNLYGQTFVIPEYTTKITGKRIMGLDDPSKKMSKSASSEYNYIALADSPEKIRQKIRKAVTDSGTEIKHGPDKPAISNLLNIFSEITGKQIAELEDEFAGKSYGEFKNSLAEAIVSYLSPMQAKYDKLMQNPSALEKILKAGSAKIAPLAQETLNNVKTKLGLLNI